MINEMEERVRIELNGSEPNSIFCEKRNLKPFDPFFYRKIEELGKGAFGSVEKCLDIRDRTMVAVKKINIKEQPEYDERLRIISFFLVETEVLRRIKETSHPNLEKILGEFYIADNHGIIESLVLVSEAGEFSLKELFNCRLNSRSEEEKKKHFD